MSVAAALFCGAALYTAETGTVACCNLEEAVAGKAGGPKYRLPAVIKRLRQGEKQENNWANA